MSETIKVYKQSIGEMKFIGKKYGDKDRVNGKVLNGANGTEMVGLV